MSDGIRLTLAGEPPVPPESDIEITIDFNEGEGSAARVFDIAANLIRAFEDLDSVLITTIDSKISTELIVEDVEKSSLKIWLRSILKASDDDAIKTLDWKPQVGKYLVKAKYIVLEWLDRNGDNPPKLEDLTTKIRALAAETDVRHLPDYPPPNAARLAQPLDAIQRTKAQFRPGEKLTITLDKQEYQVDLRRQWLPSENLLLTATEQELVNEMDMVLVIKKLDLLAKSQWTFKHGKAKISAPIDDLDWIREFHDGKHPITPGDALRARVRFEYHYDSKGDLREQRTSIVKVYGVVHPPAPPRELFDDQ